MAMYAMQYELTLPADYNMQIIRHRVVTRGTMTDDFAGLGLKAYLIRERGKAGSSVNQYAPFYLWASVAGMNRFLWGGGGFRGIIASFGRPSVAHWTGVAFLPGPARELTPRAAVRSIEAIPGNADLEALVGREAEQLKRRVQHPNVHSSAFAIDPKDWQVVRFTLWENTAPDDDPADARFEVLHLSKPHIGDLAADLAFPVSIS
jgi:Domain of unknown function (DUF4865)